MMLGDTAAVQQMSLIVSLHAVLSIPLSGTHLAHFTGCGIVEYLYAKER